MGRVLRVLVMVLAAVVLAACGGAVEEDRLVEPDKPKSSSSGQYTAYVEAGPETSARQVLIKDAQGVEVFRDSEVYRVGNAGRLSATWLSTADQLWILSTDIGTRHVDRDSATGEWSRKNIKYGKSDEIPAEIKKLERRPGQATR